jgi:hypothetical protein
LRRDKSLFTVAQTVEPGQAAVMCARAAASSTSSLSMLSTTSAHRGASFHLLRRLLQVLGIGLHRRNLMNGHAPFDAPMHRELGFPPWKPQQTPTRMRAAK